MVMILSPSKMFHLVLPLGKCHTLPKILKVAYHVKDPSFTGKSRKLIKSEHENSKEALIGNLPESLSSTHVPKGCLAVYVGPELRRFVIPASYISMPDFRVLMDKAEEEFGFEHEGGIQIPCEEQDFKEVLVRCKGSKSKKHKKIL